MKKMSIEYFLYAMTILSSIVGSILYIMSENGTNAIAVLGFAIFPILLLNVIIS